MAEVSLHQVRKSYGSQTVLQDINLHIRDGEFMVFVGPSGCGKSTLLRMIAGLEEITDGELQIAGVRANETPPAQRGLAMVFQSYALYPHMTVFENMAFALSLTRMAKAEIRKAVEQAAEKLQISHLLDRKPKDLSGGQRQRVAIGRAIVRQPQLFLLDEPLSNLDASLRVQTRIELSRLHQELQSTMIYVTHDQVEAMTLGQRIAVFHAGGIAQVGTPMELYHQPATRFVAGFLGSPKMNFFQLRLLEVQPAALRLSLPGLAEFSIPVSSAALPPAQLQPGAPWTLGVRAEHWQLSSAESAAAEGYSASFTLQLGFVEQLGDSNVLYLSAAGQDGMFAMRVSAAAALPAPGQSVQVSLNLAHCHLFDADGQAVQRSQSVQPAC